MSEGSATTLTANVRAPMKSPVPAVLALLTFGVVFGAGWFHAEFRDRQGSLLSQAHPAWYVALSIAVIISVYASGLPDEPRDRLGAGLSCLLAPAIGSFGFLLLQTLIAPKAFPRFVPSVVPIVLAPLHWIAWGLQQRFVARQSGRERVLAILSEADLPLVPNDDELADPETPWCERPYTLVAAMLPDEAAPSAGLIARAEAGAATLLVLGTEAQQRPQIVEQASRLHERGVRVRTVNRFSEEWLGKVTVAELGPMALMFDIADVHRARYARMKRGIDVLVALAALPVLLVAVCLVPAGNLLGNAGPLFFRQPRVGRDNKTFTILKFRTLLAGTDHRTPTATKDARVTAFGRLLRRFHIDELPQLWNVLRGDLSIIGPRPEQPHLVAQYAAAEAAYSLRHAVRPGLTGWAQVKYRYGEDEADAVQKLQYDLYYLKNQTLALDLQIIIRTVRHIVRRGGR